MNGIKMLVWGAMLATSVLAMNANATVYTTNELFSLAQPTSDVNNTNSYVTFQYGWYTDDTDSGLTYGQQATANAWNNQSLAIDILGGQTVRFVTDDRDFWSASSSLYSLNTEDFSSIQALTLNNWPIGNAHEWVFTTNSNVGSTRITVTPTVSSDFLSIDSAFTSGAAKASVISSVPEPETYALMAMGLLGLGLTRRRSANIKPSLAV